MKFDQLKKSKKLVVDSTLIIFSVLFALFINECRSSAVERGKTEKMLKNIKIEIQNNHTILKDLKEYHSNVFKNIQTAYEQDSLESTFFPGNFFIINKVADNGIIQQTLTDIAWEIGKQNNISSRIEFESSLVLYEAYDQQKVVNETIDLLVSHLSTREILRKELLGESVFMIGREFNELIGQEGVLLRDYENALEILKEKEN